MIKFLSVRALVNYIQEVKSELEKVTWPKKEEIIKLTLIVFIISGVVSFYLGVLDFTFTKLLELTISK
ncbi:preprotein translocase subunit SecE [Candidatus Woesebacteria bacterium RIFCSPHIGHO2_01_FULL_38_10]|uniref:Protein translocase subunit SecE n=1 Tax=Candidatus Woesebacteria bacterium RIFCSPLOWO2_01_FULL_39_10b TaxID=1802517 RepID=A0A1F8B909_9BACT|nr:MAG: preprotein translocase subunit SecE [Candidatus Woesebacteria bacterium RIFCSPHIGHO2_01_FULL_38_10]OGM60511.1 MAG: preprotein translocase subunit SecE [Candidatus Woesebacteria bacterium RIFCSPLOWO2_01_FULL_39_10b]